MDKVLFSSVKKDWGTPPEVMEFVEKRWGKPNLDVCALPEDKKAEYYLSPPDAGLYGRDSFCLGEDGKKISWPAAVALATGEVERTMFWMNPPYGPTLTYEWLGKAVTEAKRGIGGVVLLPTRTETRWWHQFVWPFGASTYYAHVRDIVFWKGRIKFVGAEHGAPFPSVLLRLGLPEKGEWKGEWIWP